MLPSVYVFLSTSPCACSWVFSVVLGGTDLSKRGWRKSFIASAVINESFGSHLGQLFHLRLCKTEGKYWSYLEMRLVIYFFFLLPGGKLISGSLSPVNSHWGCSLGAASADKIPASALPLLLCGRAAFAAAQWIGFRKLKSWLFGVFSPLGSSAEPQASSSPPCSYTKSKGHAWVYCLEGKGRQGLEDFSWFKDHNF